MCEYHFTYPFLGIIISFSKSVRFHFSIIASEGTLSRALFTPNTTHNIYMTQDQRELSRSRCLSLELCEQ